MAEIDGGLDELLLGRVSADPALSEKARELILAAYEGDEPLRSVLGGGPPSGAAPTEAPARSRQPRLYLQTIRVQGFRGIGPSQKLTLTPGPGLTVVTGRNGSGKSSFAEAAELALTGGNSRWDAKTNNKVLWRDGWRNLHASGPTEIEVDVVAAGEPGPFRMRMAWPGDDLDERSWTRQRHQQRREEIGGNWLPDAATHRPFLSYGELGALIDSKPSELHDKLHVLLGLGDLDVARDLLREERRPFDERAKRLKEDREQLLGTLRGIDDERARRAEAALQGRKPDLDTIAALALGEDADVERISRLRALRELRVPEADAVQATAAAVHAACDAVDRAATPEALAAASIADLLDQALAHQHAHGDGRCPVCGAGTLDAQWRARAEAERDRLRAIAAQLREAQAERAAALTAARRFAVAPPAVLVAAAAAEPGAAEATTAWRTWHGAGDLTEPAELADALVDRHAPLVDALDRVRRSATAELVQLDENWRPIASRLLAWHDAVQHVAKEKPLVDDLKQAENWLRRTAGELRGERIAPFAARSQQIWARLRQESSVSLDGVALTGSGTQRKLVLDVTVDGSGASALSVMSQGELHALGLALFLPRAMVGSSPFGFLMIDDPVQAMDPAKVDGLAQVLADVARTRQVIVFSHDDRLAEAVRRLTVPATIWEVRRKENSQVDLIRSSDPVERYLSDAWSVLAEQHMPEQLRRELVGTCCRGALEAAAHEKVRKVRLGRGERHDDVEDALAKTQKTHDKVTLAIFDDPGRGGDLLAHLNRRVGGWAADTLQACKEGAHCGGYPGKLSQLIKGTEKLAGVIRS